MLLTTTLPPKLAIDKAMKDLTKMGLQGMSDAVKMMKYDLLDTERKKRFIYGLGTLPVFYLATCGMVDEGAVLDKNGEPMYAKFTPGGPGKTPSEYIDTIHTYKPQFEKLFEEGGEYVC